MGNPKVSTAAALLASGAPTLSVADAAKVAGVSKNHAYALIAAGEWPTRVLRLGRAIRVPTADLARYVGLDAPAA